MRRTSCSLTSLPAQHPLRRGLLSPTTLALVLPSSSPPPAHSSAANADAAPGATPDPSSFPFTEPQAQDALQQLSTILSHHLGSLTSTIAGYADLLVDTPSVQEQREIAMNVLEASAQIDDLLADLRYFSRPLEPVARPVSVSKLVGDVIDLLAPEDRTRTEPEVHLPADYSVEADPRLLRQALLSLVHNALEATAPPHTVRLHVQRLNASDAAQTVSFDVWNEGEIELERPSDVFLPFFTTRARRLGLGLPIASHIAAQHGGTLALTANSTADGGTCFTLQV